MKQREIETDDDRGGGASGDLHPARIDEWPHFRPIAGQADEGNDRKGQLHAENNLAENEELRSAARAVEGGNGYRGNDRQAAGDQAPQPRRQLEAEEAFHHDLPSKGRRHRRAYTLSLHDALPI